MSRFSDMFATWNRVRFVISLIMIAAVASLAISAWQMQSDAGGLDRYNTDWDNFICKASPYMYFTPFRFKWEFSGSSGGPCYCPWSLNNSIFRLCLGSVSIIFAIPLFWKNPYSEISGQYALFFAAFLWYSAFVLDIAALVISTQMCASRFGKSNTPLGVYIEAGNIKIECLNGPYAITVGIDAFASACSFLAWMAWSNCENL